MGFLQGKRIVIAGMVSNRSIAAGIAAAMHREGAELAFTYQNDRIAKRVEALAGEFGSNIVLPCDVSDDQQISDMVSNLKQHWDSVDGLIHSIAFAPKEELKGRYIDNVTRDGFRIAHDVSSYSFTALGREIAPMMAGRNGAMLTLSYLGAVRWIPNYNVMALAKASLEANVRYMASDLGMDGIRVNAVSAGPIKTLASAGITGFKKLLDYGEHNSPLRRNVTIEDVGNTAAFLCSDLGAGITGQTIYVDAGFNNAGVDIATLSS